MPYTYSTPETRARTRRAAARDRSDAALEQLLLAAAAVLFLAGVFFVWNAKDGEARASTTVTAGAQPVLNLSTIKSADALAPYLSVFPDDTERRFVARELLARLTDGGARPLSSSTLPNVGTLGRIMVEAARVENTPGLPTLRARLDELRRRRGAGNVTRISLLTPGQVATIKPTLVVRTVNAFRWRLVLAVLLVVLTFGGLHAVRYVRGRLGDPLLMSALFVLCGLGLLLMVSLRDPLRDVLLFVPFAQGVLAGGILLVLATWIDLERSALPRLSYVPLVAAVALSVLLILFGSGPGGSDARVNLFGVQPVDAVRLLVTLFFAGYFAQRWEFLRELREPLSTAHPVLRRFHRPRRGDLVPVIVGLALVLLGFFLQKDLGPALVIACVFLALYGVARRGWVIPTVGLLLLVLGFVVGHWVRISSTLAARIAMWQSPWDNGVRGGDQVAQALWAFASGGLTGAGLGQGMAEVMPAAHTDLVLAAAGEELGLAGVVAIALLYAVMAARGFRIARRAPGEYSTLLALGLTIGLVFQVLLIAGGLLDLVPLSGVVTPFLSYGRSALLADFVTIGLLLSIAERAIAPAGTSAASTDAGTDLPSAPFLQPMKHLGWLLCTVFAIVLGTVASLQAWRSDDVMVRGALTRQADGQRRFMYNPRLLAAAELLVRGTVTDRNGLPIATNQPEMLQKNEASYTKAGIRVKDACPEPGQRCYPLGGPAFHLVGDFETQTNWAAPNTSFSEREEDARLRGYDDQARVVETRDPEGGATGRALQRNLRPLLPLWKHRANLSHPSAARLLQQPRDVRLTIDARLQLRVANLLRSRLAAARLQRGAAVVIDADSGELLASVSYPWPETTRGRVRRDPGEGAEQPSPALLDRARYGVYPPGSTFKIVTATAVLRSSPTLADEPLHCVRLEDGRVGAHIPGWRRPVRDDVTDTVPHGAVTLERGIVQSCNAYFAQLGVRVGARALRDAAALFDIALTRGGDASRLRDTLPFASYGQGEVLATPFRMARVAAAIGAGGVLPPVVNTLDEEAPRAAGTRVLDAGSARRLADAMRQVVLVGTGRGLLAHPEFVAGKTGTAEIEGAPSHSWFIGFAPYGQGAGRRIAFAVIVENGGYGGRVAAPIAGDIVTAARELGLFQRQGTR